MRNRDFRGSRGMLAVAALAGALALGGCDKFELPSRARSEAQAREAEQAGDFPRAVRMYEAILDGTAKTAGAHLQLALIYDDKLHDPVSSLHHFRRYLRMTDDLSRKTEVQGYVKRIELVLATQAADGGLMTKREAARLKNENLALAEEMARLKGELAAERQKPKAPDAGKPDRDAKGFSSNPQTAAAERAIGRETRTYAVEKGDTLAAISRKFYNTPQRWKDILDANQNTLNGSVNLKIGQVLIIPK